MIPAGSGRIWAFRGNADYRVLRTAVGKSNRQLYC